MAEVVTTSEAVAATPARGAKIAAIAGLLARLDPGEVEPVVAFLAGEPRQGRIGVGWATLVGLAPVPADEATLTVTEVDCGLGEVLTTTGAGSVGARAMLLTDLLGRATAPEADFLRRLLTGGLRQGALEGVMA
ncbi:MAG: ATP-dependent DNA ligase, partial [Acidimicrobiia bacterium]